MKRARFRSLAHYLDKTGARQQDVAQKVGVQQGYISRIARGEIVPRPDLAKRICAVAHCPLDSFIREKRRRQTGPASAVYGQSSTQGECAVTR